MITKVAGQVEQATSHTPYGLFRAARDIINGEVSLDDFNNWGEKGRKILEEQVAFLKAHPDFDIEDTKLTAPKGLSTNTGVKKKVMWFLKTCGQR